MSPLRARVEKGRLVLDETTTLPEGTIIDLVADDEGDDLTDDERRALHDALSSSWRSAEAGRLRPAWRFSTSCAAGGEPAGPHHHEAAPDLFFDELAQRLKRCSVALPLVQTAILASESLDIGNHQNRALNPDAGSRRATQ